MRGLTMPRRKPSSIAIHEAAHAVVAWALGSKVDRITLGPKPGHGLTVTRTFRYRGCSKPDPVVVACIQTAGYVADLLWNGAVSGRLPAEDYVNWKREGVGKWGHWVVRDWLMPVLRARRRQVMRVARALDERGTLTGKEFLKVIEKWEVRRV